MPLLRQPTGKCQKKCCGWVRGTVMCRPTCRKGTCMSLHTQGLSQEHTKMSSSSGRPCKSGASYVHERVPVG
jgi:hypothetical protein